MENELNKKRISFNPCTQELMDESEEIVISGIAGRFPDSDNIRHLQENLFNKVDLVTDDNRRWDIRYSDVPPGTGKINNINKFDASFFDINFKQAHTMDPAIRLLLEHTYEAIIDAGINPQHLRGTKTGVFIGSCVAETEEKLIYQKNQAEGLGIVGCSRGMLSSIISYCFNFTGPSYSIDTACSSSLYAMDHAYRAIRDGQCDIALVGGASLCLHPYISQLSFQLGILSPDHRCKCFDDDANGYARSEAITVLLLQKFKNAKRIYATVVHGKTNCDGFKEQGITFPSVESQKLLLEEFYKECRIPPNSLEYVEAHGTGTHVGDPEELNAIDGVFCTGRKEPLKIGSVKSNLGHAEPASGICSVIKVIIANETGLLPPNIHYNRPRRGVEALKDGRIQVVTEPTPWPGGLVGINSFGFGGANAHILLKSNPKEKINGGRPKDDLPRLIVVSGRTEEAVKNILRDIESRPIDVEYVKLLHDIHGDNIPGHSYRGYTILRNNNACEKFIRKIKHFNEVKQPVWFVFSGMKSQSVRMNTALLRFPVFAKSIEKCNNVLKSHDIDIYDILTKTNKSTFENIMYSSVGTAAIQIGLIDLLASMNIVPDYIIGYSIGERACAYADSCITAEQMVLGAYYEASAFLNDNGICASMNTNGFEHKFVKDFCPRDIEVACSKSVDNSTISEPAESTEELKLRSTKWVRPSALRNSWPTVKDRLSSAECQTNELKSAVTFEELFTMIPENSVTIEITSNGFLYLIKKPIDPEAMNGSLLQCHQNDHVEIFLQTVGELFNIGLQPMVSNLYPKVEYPVSRGTPMISPLIKWDHSYDWYVCRFQLQDKIDSGVRSIEVSLADANYETMIGHVIDGRNLLPAAGYLALVWETLGMMRGEFYTRVSVVFQNIKFLRATTLPKEGIVTLTVMIQKGTGRFEVGEGGETVATGQIHFTPNPSTEKLNPSLPNDEEMEEITERDFYKELTLRGYQYDGLFKGIKSSTINGSRGRLAWSNNWVAFMENMLQMKIFGIDTRSLVVPTGIQKLIIDTEEHYKQIRSMSGKKEFSVHFLKTYDMITTAGVQIRGLKVTAIPRRIISDQPVLQSYKFLAHRDRAKISFKEAVHLATHVVTENNLVSRGKLLEIVEENENSIDNLISLSILETLNSIPIIQGDVSLLGNENTFEEGSLPQNMSFVKLKNLPADTNALLLSGRNLLTQKKIFVAMPQLLFALKDDGFILTLEPSSATDLIMLAKNHRLNVIIEKVVGKSTLLLLRKQNKPLKDPKVVQVNNNKFLWFDDLKSIMKSEMEHEPENRSPILVVGEEKFESGVLGLVHCLRREPGGEMIRGFLIQDEKAPNFSKSIPLYANQLKLDLAINVLRSNGEWGTYQLFPLVAAVPRACFHGWADQLVRGDLSSIQWFEGPIRPDCSHPDIVRIIYSAINFSDVMLATGKLITEVGTKSRVQQQCALGFEFSGIDSAGKRVMGIIPSRALANHAILDRNLTWYVPDNWTLEDAATVPCAYATSYYALYIKGNMKKGDKILIHAGAGGVGQAAIQLALNDGCEVFTTVGTAEKRRFIKHRFPQIPDNHIGNSRDTSFEQLILRETNRRGVDIVLNSLANEKLQASIRCLAVGGRFLEIGKFNMLNDSELNTEIFRKGISFHSVILDNLFNAVIENKLNMKRIFQKGLDEDSIKPLNRTVFTKNHMEEAFRYMSAGKHIGKVIVQIADEQNLNDVTISALPQYYCLPDRSYVIIGGLGGFGVELVDWLILRGARNVVLTSRTGLKNGYQRLRVELWRSYGVRVIIISGKNAENHEDCAEILKTATELQPVDAIFNVAVVLKDKLWENQTPSQFEETFKPKAWSSKVLDELSRKLCPQLRHFVMFSSLSSSQGTAGQINYGMSNSVMERICEKRIAEGFPALAIQWGPIGDVGLITQMQDSSDKLIIGGKSQQKISSCLHELNGFLTQDSTIVSTTIVSEKEMGTGARNIVEIILDIMNIKDLNAISHQIPLPELGMDSIMSIEIEHALKQEFEISLTAQNIRSLNFANLIGMSKSPEDKLLR
ncbi:hypothetical protein PV327_010892 [Microctonus hyperodae]|uniref:Uncharacterized protein n=1 Tax=Microctonus hyperodae TaxID=165561 RepID=A0AA39C8F4_MICHY|nr:hypothetical protein PV327_010892 [Microctonus hyperodae]